MLSPDISCGAYSVPHGSISSISPKKHENIYTDCHMLGRILEDSHRFGGTFGEGPYVSRAKEERNIPPYQELSGFSYYGYH